LISVVFVSFRYLPQALCRCATRLELGPKPRVDKHQLCIQNMRANAGTSVQLTTACGKFATAARGLAPLCPIEFTPTRRRTRKWASITSADHAFRRITDFSHPRPFVPENERSLWRTFVPHDESSRERKVSVPFRLHLPTLIGGKRLLRVKSCFSANNYSENFWSGRA